MIFVGVGTIPPASRMTINKIGVRHSKSSLVRLWYACKAKEYQNRVQLHRKGGGGGGPRVVKIDKILRRDTNWMAPKRN